MKDLITCVASVMLLMVFLQQFVLNQTTYARLAGAENAAKEFGLELEDSGDRDIDAGDVRVRKLKESIAACVGCEPSEVSFSMSKISESENYEVGSDDAGENSDGSSAGESSEDSSSGSSDDGGSNMETRVASTTYGYEIRVPVRNIIGSADFLGITDEENQIIHTFRSTAKIEEEIEGKGDSDEQHDTHDSDAHIDGLTS